MSFGLTVSVADGAFGAYIARPATLPAPVVIVVQELFGVTDGIRQIADGLARAGYVAVAPDLFWRFSPGIMLSEHSKDDWQTALGYYQRLDLDLAVADLAAVADVARGLPEGTGRVGVMGFCLGGLLAFLAADHVDAAVDYYGSRTDEFVERAVGRKTPLLLHLAGNDEFMDSAARARIVAALKDVPEVEIHQYPGRSHAFARPHGDHFHAEDAALAERRTHAFLAKHLR